MKTILFTILLTVTILSCSTTNNTSCGGYYLEPIIYISRDTATYEYSLLVQQTYELSWQYNKDKRKARRESKKINLGTY